VAVIEAMDCELVERHLGSYVDSRLDGAAAAAVREHLAICPACRASIDEFRAVHNLLEYVGAETRNQPAPESEAAPSSRFTQLGSAPWWLVSLALHVLLIALASLISMAIELPRNDDGVIMVTELQPRVSAREDEKQTPKPAETALLPQREVAATDPLSKEVSDVVVPPDILAKAEVGDHWETINPDRPDTHSAYGNEDARSFHSVTGNAEPAGGGGMGGIGMEDVIGIGGAASKGTGGGFGGGDGSGTGVQTGAGHGSFGNRNGGGRKQMVKRHGGSAATESAVDKALQWLAYHQEPDGSWAVKKHGGSLPETCSVGITGLATLAFLGAGHTEKIGQYKENVKRAIDYLISQQSKDGGIGENKSPSGWLSGAGYNHPIAAMALAEAYGMARISRTGEAAQSAVYYSVETHWDSVHKVWHYAKPSSYIAGNINGAYDNISVVTWFVMQLKSAKVAGLHFDHVGIYTAVSEWLDKMGEPGGDDYGKHLYRYEINNKRASSAATSMGLVSRLFMGTPSHELEKGAELLISELPKWDPSNGATGAMRGPCPHYYWYYGTLSLFQYGGNAWKQWNEALKKTLLPTQRKDGDEAGSWDLIGNDGPFAGRAYTTALGALCLEIYYRYALLNPEK
jgi:hypothetical protein